jgi:hypothetical protein
MTYTSTDPKRVKKPAPTLEEICKAVEDWAKQARMIGILYGHAVWVTPDMPHLNVELRDANDMVLMRFPVDHPFLDGTKLQQVARKALNL